MSVPPPDEAAAVPAAPCALPPDTRMDFAEFYRATVAPLRGYLAKLLGNAADAQDVAQNAYIRVQPVVEPGTEKPHELLYLTARRLALNELRRRRTHNIASGSPGAIALTPPDPPSVERLVEARQRLEEFEQMLLKLPPGCRQIFLLRKVEDMSNAEIAARLRLSIKTVEAQMTRAYRLLREAYDKAAADRPNRTSS